MTESSAPQLLKREDIKLLGISLSNTQLLRLEAKNRFPRRIYLTPGKVVWYAHEIHLWIDARAAERSQRIYSNY